MVNLTQPSELTGQPVVITLPVQWGDQDAFGHVNNVVYFRWMESARIEYFRLNGLTELMDRHGAGMILATIKCDFRRQLTHPDTMLVSASIASVGRTSMKMAHLVYSTSQQVVVAEGDSVIVMFDYKSQRPFPVPDDIRAKIDELERRSGPGAVS